MAVACRIPNLNPLSVFLPPIHTHRASLPPPFTASTVSTRELRFPPFCLRTHLCFFPLLLFSYAESYLPNEDKSKMVDTTSMEGGGGTTSAAMRATTEFQISNKWRYSREVATASPERTKVWTEPSNSNSAPRRVPVIYYLNRNGHLEHPHFMEVPLSSSDGLYLKGMCNSMSSNHLSGIFSMIIHSNFPYRLL